MSDLPTGTVTFLISDIEGSTRLLTALGDEYAGVLARHDAVIRSAIAEGGGHEVSTEGDSFFAVFRTPLGALRAAAAAQRELAAGPWPEAAAVRVRMGLHTGEGVLGGANYVGLDVNRTARIAAAGHGGQVLVSDATRAVIDRDLPPGLTLRDLGHHRLKDLVQPERLYEVVISGLEADFPPPTTLDAQTTNLPSPLTRFIGREPDVAAIRQLLMRHRLVTMTGPGGIGKTRLAIQVGAEELAKTSAAVFFVDLSALSDPALVPQDIAAALRVRAEPGRPVLDTVIDHLRDKDVLLVIDNVEQLLDVGPQVLGPLLEGASRVRALVTSRVPLHLYGEHEYPVAPLAEVEAITLFAERASAVQPGFAVTAENARAVADITARLDALPLAIELAASRIKVLSPDGLLQRLDQRLALLRGYARNLPERQRTLRNTIEWSYDLLTDAEKNLFWRMAVFAGGADLDAVEAVANPDGELELATLDGVSSLVDKNLLRRLEASVGVRDEPRFGMLETIREYGLERLSHSADESIIRRRHAEHWIAVAERAATGPTRTGQFTQVRQLAADLDNFRAALAWAMGSGEVDVGLRLGAALRLFWRLEGHVAEGLRWLDTLLDQPGATGRTALRARALTAAADMSGWTGDADTYLSHAQEAVAIYRDLGDPQGIPDALEELGAALIGVGQPDAARASLEEARARNLAMGNRQGAAECTLVLGIASAVEGQPGQARARFEEGLAMFTELHDPFFIALGERLIGQADRFEGKFDAAEKRFRSSLIASRDHELPVVAAGTLYAMAELAVARGLPDRALRLMGASEALRDQVGEAPSGEVAFLGDVRGAAAALMDDEAADRLFLDGRSMSFADAISYALVNDRDERSLRQGAHLPG